MQPFKTEMRLNASFLRLGKNLEEFVRQNFIIVIFRVSIEESQKDYKSFLSSFWHPKHIESFFHIQ